MTDPINSMRLRDDADVMPESVPYLRLPENAVEIRGAGWTHRELQPPKDDHSERVIVWIAAGAAFWVLLVSGLWWGMKAGWW